MEIDWDTKVKIIKNNIENVNIPSEPDFGFHNSINYEDKPPGWNLFLELVDKYPRRN
jgi:hypothetical protein